MYSASATAARPTANSTGAACQTFDMNTKATLHELVDRLNEDQADLARMCLEDLADAVDAEGPSLAAAALASLDRGLADVSAGRVKSIGQYERERGV